MSAAVTPSFWKRIGHIFRGAPGAPDNLMLSGISNGHSASDPPLNGSNGSSSGLSHRRRPPSRTELRDGYHKVVDLMDGMQAHFDRQGAQAEELVSGLGRVASTLEQLAQSQARQSEYMQSIAGHANSTDAHTAALVESLRQIPASLNAQAMAMRSIGRQMESSAKADAQLLESMQQFSQVVEAVRIASASQNEILRHLHADEREQRAALTTLIRQMSMRFLVALIVAGVMGMIALAGLVVALYPHLVR